MPWHVSCFFHKWAHKVDPLKKTLIILHSLPKYCENFEEFVLFYAKQATSPHHHHFSVEVLASLHLSERGCFGISSHAGNILTLGSQWPQPHSNPRQHPSWSAGSYLWTPQATIKPSYLFHLLVLILFMDSGKHLWFQFWSCIVKGAF